MPRASAATSRACRAYARQFLEMMQKPDVEHIDGLSPAISIEQKTTSRNPRSTVATVTEIYDYMRLLWARVGVPYSPATGLPIEAQTGQPDGRPGDGAARRQPPLPARPGRPRPQGRVSQGARRVAEGRLHPRPHRRRVLRDRGRPRARQEVQARHRGGGRPHRRPRRHRAAPRRQLRDRAQARRRASPTSTPPTRAGTAERDRVAAGAEGSGRGQARLRAARPHHLLREIRLPGLAASPSPRSSRGCSASTPRRAPARPATASARNWCSTRTSSSPTTPLDRQGRGRALGQVQPALALITCRCCRSLARAYDFDLDTPWGELPEEAQRRHPPRHQRPPGHAPLHRRPRSYEVKKPFEGVIGNLNRRMLQTESAWMREELSRYQSSAARARSATAPASGPSR